MYDKQTKECSILEELFLSKHYEIEQSIKKKSEIKEEKELEFAEEKLISILKENIKDENVFKEVLNAINNFENTCTAVKEFWNLVFYKLGHKDQLNMQNELLSLESTSDVNLTNENILYKLKDEDILEGINEMIEAKFDILKRIPKFKEKDSKLSKLTETFETNLQEIDKETFNTIMQLTYEVEDYYFAFSYFLGQKHK